VHEAGIARAIAETLRAEGLLDVPVRVLVTGGHDDPAAFDASLLFHFELAAPDVDLALVRIVHLPSDCWCPTCGHRFEAVGEVDCPACGGPTMGSRLDEHIEIERADGPGPSDPGDGDGRPSAAGGPTAHASSVEPIAVPPHEHGPSSEHASAGDRAVPDPAQERPDDRVT
jgi:hypothetical protein